MFGVVCGSLMCDSCLLFSVACCFDFCWCVFVIVCGVSCSLLFCCLHRCAIRSDVFLACCFFCVLLLVGLLCFFMLVCSLFVVRCSLRVVRWLLLLGCYVFVFLGLVIACSLVVVRCVLFVACCMLLVVR